jgi:hypothetical protein
MNLYQVGALGSQVSALPGYLGVLARLFEEMGLDDLVNRRTEIVKLIVPLQGLTRRHPLVGALGEDAMTQAPAWGVDPLLTAGGALGPFGALTPQTGELAGLVAKIGLDMLPRHFVVYVKQRLVLLDVLFYLLEILQFLFTFFSAIQGLTTNSKKILKTEELRARYLSQPAEKRAIVEALLAQPEIQASLARAADLSDSGIAVTSRNQAFLAQVQTAEAALENTVADPAERRQIAVGRVADAYAAEYPDYQLVQVLAAVQPRQTLAVVNQLAVNRAVEKKMTLADELSAGGPAVFADADALPVYSELRAALDARKVSDYVSGVDSTLTAKELLARSPDEARQLLGADNYEKFRVAFQTDRNTAVAGAQALAQGVPDALAVKVEAGIQAGTSAETVIDTLKSDERRSRHRSLVHAHSRRGPGVRPGRRRADAATGRPPARWRARGRGRTGVAPGRSAGRCRGRRASYRSGSASGGRRRRDSAGRRLGGRLRKRARRSAGRLAAGRARGWRRKRRKRRPGLVRRRLGR